MNFTFEEMKKLFDEFSIKKNETGEFCVVKRRTDIIYDNLDLVNSVKFAHTWIKATEHNRSRTTSITNIISEEDYNYAFDDSAKDIYNCIMGESKQMLEFTGQMIKKDTLIKALNLINESTPLRAHYGDIVEGLYSNKRFYDAFENWSRRSTKIQALFPVQQQGNVEPKRI